MLTLAQAANKQKSGAQLLPDLFPALANDGVRFRRGQVTMIAGQPNSGKSLLALFYAVKSDVPTLYVSADKGIGAITVSKLKHCFWSTACAARCSKYSS